jgi:glycosyltransferase involved in cell wall biosynthesis
MPRVRRLVTIGHSYVIAANRRLAHEMAVQGKGRWDVTAIAPVRYRADLGRVAAHTVEGEASVLKTLNVRMDRSPHLMWYAGLDAVLADGWDVVHCWEEPYVAAGAQVARTVPSSARLVVATFQNLAKRYPWPLSGFERTSMARADGWIAFGHTVNDTLRTREGYAERPSRVIPPGVDLERFRPDADAGLAIRSRLGWGESDLVVGFLGRFVPEKGVQRLVEALRASRAKWRALLVGGGPEQRAIDALARAFRGRVHVANGVIHDEVPHWLNAMTLLCAPSQTTTSWREQFGRMLIEAMACGVPVLASHSGEMPHVVADAGTLLPENDVRAWTEAIDRLLDDGVKRADHRTRGLDRVSTHYAWPVVARAHLEFFETLTSDRS